MSTLAGGSQEAGDLGLELCRSLKCEEVNLKAYDTVLEARAGIKEWIRFYNYGRTPAFFLKANNGTAILQQVNSGINR